MKLTDAQVILEDALLRNARKRDRGSTLVFHPVFDVMEKNLLERK